MALSLIFLQWCYMGDCTPSDEAPELAPGTSGINAKFILASMLTGVEMNGETRI